MPNCVSLGRPLGGRPGGSPRTSMGWDMTHRGRHRSYQGRPRTPRGRPNCPADVHGTVDALWTQHSEAQCLAKWSMIMSVAGVVISVIAVIIFVITLYFTWAVLVASTYDGYYRQIVITHFLQKFSQKMDMNLHDTCLSQLLNAGKWHCPRRKLHANNIFLIHVPRHQQLWYDLICSEYPGHVCKG